jgi:hypothetical protein
MSHGFESETSGRLYGLMAEFDSPSTLVNATHRAYERGHRKMDAYAPFPIEELAEALGAHHSRLPLMVLIGGIFGCFAGFGLQYWVNVVEYPLNVAGRPFNSWPMFIPVTFEMTILFAALTAVFGMFALCGLPTPYHPVFNNPRFSAASKDRYFLCIEAEDGEFDRDETRNFLASLGPTEVTEVDH